MLSVIYRADQSYRLMISSSGFLLIVGQACIFYTKLAIVLYGIRHWGSIWEMSETPTAKASGTDEFFVGATVPVARGRAGTTVRFFFAGAKVTALAQYSAISFLYTFLYFGNCFIPFYTF